MRRITPAAVERWPAGVATFGAEDASRMLAAAAEQASRWLQAARLTRWHRAVSVLRRTRRMLAHDIRSPLGVVLGHGQLLEEGLISPEEARGSGTVMMRQVQRIATLADEGALDAVEGASAVLGGRRIALASMLQALDIEASGGSGCGVWGRPGALQELLLRLVDAIPSVVEQPWRVCTAVRPSRLVLQFAVDEVQADAAGIECARALRALGGSLRMASGSARLELPGDDGRLAVDVMGGTPQLVEGLRAQGLRVVVAGEPSDVVLVGEGARAPLTLAPVLLLGAGRGAGSVPARQDPAHLARLLRDLAAQPPCLDAVSGAEPEAPDGGAFDLHLRIVAAGPLGEEEVAAALVELLDAQSVERLARAPGQLWAASREPGIADWLEREGLPQVLPAFPGVRVSIGTVGEGTDASIA